MICGLLISAFFTVLGLPLARAVTPIGVAPLGLAPALGWAVFSALALPLLSLVGFGALEAGALAAACAVAALGFLRRTKKSESLPLWTVPLAAAMALLPATAILPKFADDGVLLGPPMFDHVKIAIVDGILRTGLPVDNPFFANADGHLTYYYLWHFTTAVAGAALHVDGWTAEAAMTGCTAFASMLLMMTLAFAITRGAVACIAVPLLSFSASMRPVLAFVLGSDGAHAVIPRDSDFGGWLNQAAWVPQHLASSCCVILAVLLILRLAEWGGWLAAAVLGLVVAAAFESSVWVGGVTFAVAAPAVGVMLLWRMPPDARWAFIRRAAVAVVIAAVLIAPFVAAQLAAVAARHESALAFMPYAVLGTDVPASWRVALDLPAFWLLLLIFELPAIFPLGMAFVLRAWVVKTPPEHSRLVAVLGIFAIACLSVAWLFRSTIDNNDLGWRAVLPAVLLLTAFAAGALARLVATSRWPVLAMALPVAALGLPQTVGMLRGYAIGQVPADARGFAGSAAMWRAVRRQAGPRDRVADNPLLLRMSTPWPVNISWALLSDRPSCFAGWPTVIAYGELPRPKLERVSDRFTRVFDGTALPGDVSALAWTYDCSVVVLTADDDAWTRDPFAAAADYRLVDSDPDHWRIYRRVAARPAATPP